MNSHTAINQLWPDSVNQPNNKVLISDAEDLAALRYLLDLALQPLEEFEGFTRIEQVGSSAYRYQLNFICYALAMSQFTRTPAFTGYLAEAQRNCILKMCDSRVWRYWAHENLLGNWRWNPDPIVYQNVMYSGFFAVMLGFYESLNQDRRFSEAGSLQLNWRDKYHYEYDFSKLVAAIQTNMLQSRYTQYACEPHLVYPMCNCFALNGLKMHDRLHNTNYTGDLVERVAQSYERDKFVRADGRFLGGRGPFKFAFPAFVSNDAVMALWLHGLMPEQSEKSWDLIRQHLTSFESGQVDFGKRLINKIDFGNYSLNGAWIRTFLLALSREMGDADYAAALEQDFAENYEVERVNGARAFKGVSTWANANYALVRFLRPNALQQLVNGELPVAWQTGPLLTQAAYPDVLVAYAVSDGKQLNLILQPGQGACDTTLAFGRLLPGRRYQVSGTHHLQFSANEKGEALLSIRLEDRAELTIQPQD